jgi:hypothetical protein
VSAQIQESLEIAFGMGGSNAASFTALLLGF